MVLTFYRPGARDECRSRGEALQNMVSVYTHFVNPYFFPDLSYNQDH